MVELRGLLTGERLRPVRRSVACPETWAHAGWPFIRRGALLGALIWFAAAMLRGNAQSENPRFGLYGADLALTIGVFAAIVLFVAALFVGRRSSAYGSVLHLAVIGLGVLFFFTVPERPGSALIFATVGFSASLYSLLRSLPVVVIASVGMLVAIILQHRPAGELWTIVGLLGMYTGIRASRTREASRQTEQQNLILAERSRIAREIHDILAHSLSAQLLHLEGARLLLVSGRTDEALNRVERARGLARSGLEETRRALATLRGDIPPIDVVLHELADEHRVLADAPCSVTIVGEQQELTAKAGLAVIRTTQEALTNVRKHAPGATVTITLRFSDDWCELEVDDAGATRAPGPLAESGGGYGLVGMRERAELIGGTLDAGPKEEGFSVLLRVPL